eukprot:NODE_700_length_4628_cov_1.474718.p4 type:complete len:164 gc:universal NODE_700_length_4628_cov_1.474718:2382-2873(+)
MLFIKLECSRDVLKVDDPKFTNFHFHIGNKKITSRPQKGYDIVNFNQEFYIDANDNELWVHVEDGEKFGKSAVAFCAIQLSTFERNIYAWFDLFNFQNSKQGQVLLMICKAGSPTKFNDLFPTVGVSYPSRALVEKIQGNQETDSSWHTTPKKMKKIKWQPSF